MRARVADPLSSELVVVSGRPAEHWLQTQLAQRLGICANVRFLSPSTLLAESVAAILGADAAMAESWQCDRLTWAILRLLPELLAHETFAALKFYLGSDAADGNPRAFGLARRIAECFDRYQTSRPDVIREWNAAETASTDWQRELWQRLLVEIGTPNLTQLVDRAVSQLRGRIPPASPLPSRISWLSTSSTARLPLELFWALDTSDVDMVIYSLSLPTPPGGGNTLRQSLGKQGRENNELLGESGSKANFVEDFIEPTGSSVLATLQRDLYCDARRGVGASIPIELASADDSLRIHSCHGTMRQVEVLRDELIRAFDELPDLHPRDVLVLTPAIDDFAPLIDAVFGQKTFITSSAYPSLSFRVRLADGRRSTENPIADVLLRMLSMAQGRVDAPTVLDFISDPFVLARAGLEAADQDSISRWVRESGIRWGLDGAHRAELGLPDDSGNTWRFGLDRLLLGTVMPGNGTLMYEGVLPYDEIEGEDAEILGNFVGCCERLFSAVRELSSPGTMEAWRDRLGAIIATVVDETDTALAWPLSQLRHTLDALVEESNSYGTDGVVDVGALRMLLEARLHGTSSRSGSAAGAVMVAALVPGRTMPARVVALLGLDADVFPRKRGGVGFDLLVSDRRPGDSDPGAEDRQRLLEALMAASDRVIVTYTGRDVSTNAIIPPSVPLDELLDSVDATFTNETNPARPARDLVLFEHPLQPFSPRNFSVRREPLIQSYDTSWLAGALQLGNVRTPVEFLRTPLQPTHEPTNERALELGDLAKWLAAPVKRFLQTRFMLWIDEGDSALDGREPLDVNKLVQHSLRNSLIADCLAHEDEQQLLARARASGTLPHGTPGDLLFADLMCEARGIAGHVERLREGKTEVRVDIDLSLGDVRLTGREQSVYGSRLIRYQAGVIHPHQILDIWVRHLALQATLDDGFAGSILVGKSEEPPLRLAPVADPRGMLGQLIALYDEGQLAPLPLFPRCSRAFVDAEQANKEPGKIDDLIAAEWLTKQNVEGPGGEGDDAYVKRAFGDWSPLMDDARAADFRHKSQIVWMPLLGALSKKGDA